MKHFLCMFSFSCLQNNLCGINSVIKEINLEYSLEGLMLELKLQYVGHIMQRADSFEKALMLGKFEGRRRREWQRYDGQMASSTQWT